MKEMYEGSRVRVCGTADGYREVWLTRPDARNAIDTTMRDELSTVVTAIALDQSVCAVGWFGEGQDFCAGGDLSEFGTTTDVVLASQIRLARSLPQLFSRIAPRLVVGITGAAVGAGIELAAFARRVIASPDARFRLPELTMGLIPGSGGTVSIPRRIGRTATLELLLSGRWLTAAEALEQGLVDTIVGKEEIVDRVRRCANE